MCLCFLASAADLTMTSVMQLTETFSRTVTEPKCISIQTMQDTIFEHSETFAVTLSVVGLSEEVTVTEGRSQTSVAILDGMKVCL